MHWNIVISDALKFQAKYKKNIISKTEKSLWSLLLYILFFIQHTPMNIPQCNASKLTFHFQCNIVYALKSFS